MGASGPAPHTRYLSADLNRSPTSVWHREAANTGEYNGNGSAFRLVAADRTGVLDDDKAGGVSAGGDFCLDLVQETDSEVWAGPLSGERWAVALLNRDALANATITVDWTMFNATAGTAFALRDVWAAADMGTHTGSFTANVAPQAVTYLLLTPA